jgi:RNA polymerase sigma factor (sigma-70 family)
MRSRLLHEPVRLAGASVLRLQSDDRLVELARDGHEPAFAAIVQRYHAPLTRYCAGIVGPDRADDAVQQTLISAHTALTTTNSDVRHLRSWLYRIAHNTSLNVLRAVRDDVPLDPHHHLADGPEAAIERSERLRATLAAVAGLPERQRAALLLRELEGRSHEEIAAALGVTAGSARQHLMRARAAVRTAMTAITPYPLVARLAEAMAGGPPWWGDAVAGAGAGATIAKLSAGVAATGALIGGVVGADHVARRHDPAAPTTREAAAAPARTPAHATRAAALPIPGAAAPGTPAAATTPSPPHDGGARRGNGGSPSEHRRHRSGDDDRHRSGSSGESERSGSGRGDDGGDDRSSRGSGTSGSREESDDRRIRGSSGGSGSGDDGASTSGSGTSGGGERSSSGSGDDGGEDRSGSGSGSGGTSGESGSGGGTPTTTITTTPAPTDTVVDVTAGTVSGDSGSGTSGTSGREASRTGDAG